MNALAIEDGEPSRDELVDIQSRIEDLKASIGTAKPRRRTAPRRERRVDAPTSPPADAVPVAGVDVEGA